MVVLLQTRVQCYLHLDQVTSACTRWWAHRHLYPGCPLILPIYLSTPNLNFIAMSTHDQPRWPSHSRHASALVHPFSRDIVDFPLFFSRVTLIASYSTIRAANHNCSRKRKFNRSTRELEGTQRWSQLWLRIQGQGPIQSQVSASAKTRFEQVLSCSVTLPPHCLLLCDPPFFSFMTDFPT